MIAATRSGQVIAAGADTVTATLPLASVGEGARILTRSGHRIAAVVSRLAPGHVTLNAFAPLAGVAVGDRVEIAPDALRMELGTALLGRAVDATGNALDGRGCITGRRADVIEPPIAAGKRAAVSQPLWTGIRVIDALLTIGRGARLGVFGPPAAGKSSLIEMLVRGTSADAVVVGLVGERGREAATWIERIAPHTTLVIAPLDRSPAERVRAAHVAMAQGAQLRRRGMHVLVILDSLARFAVAARELGVSNAEPVGRGGFPASAFAEMARLLERGGNCDGGSLTLIATVLSDGPEENDPLSEAARAALDGHIVLSRKLAQSGHYPAIDVAASASRTMHGVVSADHRSAASRVRSAIVLLEQTHDVRELGFTPTNAFLDRALATQGRLRDFVCQDERPSRVNETLAQLTTLARELHLP